MRILVTGAKGMLGTDLCSLLTLEHAVIGIDIDDFDITHSDTPDRIVSFSPNIVLHLAAYTDVNGCERNPEKAYLVNALGTRQVALGCQQCQIPMLYISTDFVFDGEKKEAYYEWDEPNPLNHYGHSKLAGENYIKHFLSQFFIVRTSWLFGKHGKNFVDTILRKAKKGAKISVVNDQRGSPTYTKDLAIAISQLIESKLYGIYHISNSGNCSWYEFAKKIMEFVEIQGVKIVPVSSAEYPSPTRRPAFSVLRNFCWEKFSGNLLRPWEEALKDYLEKGK
ncbi:MAG: dTDP-4-dehydrorhamnose reductase [Candidatus Edwardsbacteria bacterium]